MTRLGDLRTAYGAQQAALVTWLRALPDGAADRPSRLAGWTVQQLAFHTTEVPRALIDAIAAQPTGERALSVADYTAKWQVAAQQIQQRDRDGATGLSISDIAGRHAAEGATMFAALDQVDVERVVAARRGPIRVADMLTTRVNELVVHSLDLSASVGDVPPVEIDGRALGVSCRMLTAILAERVPGRTVEVRVPPYAAVQCVGGPRHTRGTPANVVEAQPLAWVDLAAGRLGWAEATGSGRVSASGERADISEYLPVLS